MNFEGVEHCMNSDDFFTMQQLPKSIVVLGGGVIATELVQILAALGVKVTQLARGRVLKHMDEDVVEILLDSMRR